MKTFCLIGFGLLLASAAPPPDMISPVEIATALAARESVTGKTCLDVSRRRSDLSSHQISWKAGAQPTSDEQAIAIRLLSDAHLRPFDREELSKSERKRAAAAGIELFWRYGRTSAWRCRYGVSVGLPQLEGNYALLEVATKRREEYGPVFSLLLMRRDPEGWRIAGQTGGFIVVI